jgi:hypothetical protein
VWRSPYAGVRHIRLGPPIPPTTIPISQTIPTTTILITLIHMVTIIMSTQGILNIGGFTEEANSKAVEEVVLATVAGLVGVADLAAGAVVITEHAVVAP